MVSALRSFRAQPQGGGHQHNGGGASGASGTAVRQAAGLVGSERDRFLGQELAEPHHGDVPNLDRVERLPGASHWVHHDAAERVNQLLTGFFAPALPAKNPAR
jgi:pimeloyl-ACP methyl ester carboxylesterase